ncbi:LysE family transporter [Jatrophihabitans sp.]|uniref:LysE family transporter n=1 Tax=Jatrophihabitans sp. TaxID=1932789 RepID=UPI002CCE0045|nr:LysE family transporter [Jatrophihabitans sp.]
MTAALLAGLLAGYSIAIPIGPVGTYLITLAARTSVRVGAAAALGIAAVDGAYALGATLGGAAAAEAVRPALGTLHWVSVAVLAAVAARAVWAGLAPERSAVAGRAEPSGAPAAPGPLRAFGLLAGLTAVNPTTLIYFVALVVGLRAGIAPGPGEQALFVAAAFAASASWQLGLACCGALLGRVLSGARARRATALVSGALIGVLAVRLALG